MLKRLTPVPSGQSILTPKTDEGEAAYGVWREYSINDELEAERKEHPVEPFPDIWPCWLEGRPTKFRHTYRWEPFKLGQVSHKLHERTESLELAWQPSVSLSLIAKHQKALLPPNYTYAWSGVYRIFRPETEIPRFLGRDPTGTLYVGKAGTGRGWSTLRTRVREAALRDHHVTRNWSFDNELSSLHPWEALYIEWAYTGTRLDTDGKETKWASLAEAWLLNTYKNSFGEYPPLNER
jgi:hypothetical protein